MNDNTSPVQDIEIRQPEPIDTGPWYYAQLNADGRCVCVSQASAPLPGADHLVRLESYDETVLGQTWAGDEWVSPAPAVAVRHITRLAFLQRFLDSEAIAIDLASIGATAQAAAVRRYVSLINAATYIDLDRPDTRAGVIALESLGLINAGRAQVILDTPLSAGEGPGGVA